MNTSKTKQKANRTNTTDWAQVATLDQRIMAYRFAGLFVAAEHFKLSPFASIRDTGRRSLEVFSYDGTAIYSPTTPFRVAVITWAACLGTDMRDNDWDGDINNQLDSYLCDDSDELSSTDKERILACPQTRRTCLAAAAILMRKSKRVHEVAEILMHKPFCASGDWKIAA